MTYNKRKSKMEKLKTVGSRVSDEEYHIIKFWAKYYKISNADFLMKAVRFLILSKTLNSRLLKTFEKEI